MQPTPVFPAVVRALSMLRVAAIVVAFTLLGALMVAFV